MNSKDKIIRLVLAIILSFLLATALSNLAKGSTTLEDVVFDTYPNAGLMILVVGTILLLPVIYIFLKISLWGTLIVFVLLILSYNFLFKPYKLSGLDIGPYKEDQTVHGVAKPLIFFRPISIGDVVVYKRSDVTGGSVVANVIGAAGDLTNGAKYLSKVSAGDIVPSGSFLVEIGEEKEQWVIPESQITYLIWYPLKW